MHWAIVMSYEIREISIISTSLYLYNCVYRFPLNMCYLALWGRTLTSPEEEINEEFKTEILYWSMITLKVTGAGELVFFF